jgi:hypothetical protein
MGAGSPSTTRYQTTGPGLTSYILKRGQFRRTPSRSTTDCQCSLLGGPFLLLPRCVFTAFFRLR